MAPDGTTELGQVSKADLTDEGGGLYTFTNNDGTDVQFDVRTVEITFAGGIYTFLDAAGDPIHTIDVNAYNIAYDNTASGLAATDAQAAIDELAAAFGDLELVDNNNGTFSLMAPDGTTELGQVSKADLTDEGGGLYTFTNNDGTDVQFDVRTVEITFAGGIYTFLDAAGDPIHTIDVNAYNIAYDNTASGLAATDAQAAIDELAAAFGDLELVDNNNGTFSLMAPDGTTELGQVSKADLTDEGGGLHTLTNNYGTDVQYDVRTVEITFAGGIYTFLDAAGDPIHTIDVNAYNIAYDNTASGLAATDAQAAIDELAANINSAEASNGLHIETVDPATVGHVKLGGPLTQETTIIETDVDHTLVITGLQPGNTETDKIVMADANGVLKTVSANKFVRFFYMPAVIFDTSVPGTGFTKNLHDEYVNQFTGAGT